MSALNARSKAQKPKRSGLGSFLALAMRYAWCRLNGTHREEVQEATANDKVVRIRTYCTRCGKTSGWRKPPARASRKQDPSRGK